VVHKTIQDTIIREIRSFPVVLLVVCWNFTLRGQSTAPTQHETSPQPELYDHILSHIFQILFAMSLGNNETSPSRPFTHKASRRHHLKSRDGCINCKSRKVKVRTPICRVANTPWVHQLEDDFVRLLQEEKPIPLVILSYFCILLNGLSSFWWTRGWVEHLLSEIYSLLDQEYKIWMRRPMEETGWILG
jgi:hypothetical protein